MIPAPGLPLSRRRLNHWANEAVDTHRQLFL